MTKNSASTTSAMSAGSVEESGPRIESRLARTARFPFVAFVERRPRWQRRIAGSLVLIVVAGWLAGRLADLILDRWWFSDVTDAPVWSTSLWAKGQLVVVAGVVTAAVLWGSLAAASRVSPVSPTPTVGISARYRGRMGPAHRWLMIGIVFVSVMKVMGAAVGQWQAWLLFRHGGSLETPTPEFGHDLAFYLFDLPFLTVVSSWVRTLLATAFALVAFELLVSGAIRLPGRERQSAPPAIRLLAILAGALGVAQAVHYVVVQRPLLAVSTSGGFDGAGFTDLEVVKPGLLVLAGVALMGALSLVVAVRRRSWRPAVAGMASWAVTHVVVLAVAPALVQLLVVGPAEAERELATIEHNLTATTRSYSLDRVEQRRATFADGLGGTPSDDDRAAMARLAVFATDQLVPALQVLQGTTASRISDVDLDRYPIDGVMRPMMVAARTANRRDLPEQGWVQEHLVYTHGDGVVVVPADTPDQDGRPDADAAGEIVPVSQELYFGEGLDHWYAIVGTDRRENGGADFGASTGIDLGSTWRRAVLSAAVGEIEPLLSSEVGAGAQLLFRRGLRERLHAVAPFLALDADPYPVVTDEGVVWVVDGYSTSSTYPYAQHVAEVGLSSRSDLIGRGLNSVRSSVRATVDAYDGSVHLYRTGAAGADPILAVWEEIFPGLIEPVDAIPEEISAHLRYPPDLFTVQTSLLGRYHVTDAETLFDGSERWSVSTSAGDEIADEDPGLSDAVSLFLPGDGPLAGDWVTTRTFTPGVMGSSSSRNELVAYVVGDHDDPVKIELVLMEPATDRQLSSPQVAQSAIDADPDLARTFTLLNANGSRVQFGPMTLLPLADGIVWARPIIVSGTAATTAPRVQGVVVVSSGIVAQGADVLSAIEAVSGQ